jgi:HD-like signal output (HDOD) protein
MILMEETQTNLKGWTFEIVATDLNDRSVAKAQEGLYNDYAVRNVPPEFMKKYFTKIGQEYRVADSVRPFISFNRPEHVGRQQDAVHAGIRRHLLLQCLDIFRWKIQDSHNTAFLQCLAAKRLFLSRSFRIAVRHQRKIPLGPLSRDDGVLEGWRIRRKGNDPMKTETLDRLRSKIIRIDAMPAIPVILRPLLRCLDQPAEQIDINRIVELVSYDKSIAAQCIRMANSALFSRSSPAETVRSAVMSLGMWRVRDLLFSNALSNVIPANRWVVDPTVFWRHSLGCALVCRKFADMIGYPDAEKAYLAGLLHDIGVLVNCMVAPEEFRATMEKAIREQIPLDEAEQLTLGFTHSDSGRVLAEAWKIPPDLIEVIELHHDIGDPNRGGPLVALVHLSDLLCRLRDLGYGYYEPRQVDFANEPGWLYLTMQFPQMADLDLARFTFSLDEYAREVAELVATVFTSPKPA